MALGLAVLSLITKLQPTTSLPESIAWLLIPSLTAVAFGVLSLARQGAKQRQTECRLLSLPPELRNKVRKDEPHFR